MNIKPLGNRVLVKVNEEKERVVGGIYIPETAQQKPYQGEVIAVGPGKKFEDKVIPMSVKVGDKIIYKDYAGAKLELDEEGTYLILNEDDIYAIVE